MPADTLAQFNAHGRKVLKITDSQIVELASERYNGADKPTKNLIQSPHPPRLRCASNFALHHAECQKRLVDQLAAAVELMFGRRHGAWAEQAAAMFPYGIRS